MRKVFSNSMVAHVWAQQNQSDGRSNNGQFYFDGATIFSYGRHFPIARFTEKTLRGRRVVLFTTENYSHTTASHKSEAQSALRGNESIVVLYVPRVAPQYGCASQSEAMHSQNIKYFVDSVAASAAAYANPRKRAYLGWNADDTAPLEDTEANRIAALGASTPEMLADYCEAFGLPVPSIPFAEYRAAIRAAYAKYNDPKRVKAREKARGKQHTKWARVAAQWQAHVEGIGAAPTYKQLKAIPRYVRERMPNMPRRWQFSNQEHARPDLYAPKTRDESEVTPAQWIEGKGNASALHYTRGIGTLLRRRGDNLETSQGAVVPFSHAEKAFTLAQTCEHNGREFKTNGHRVHVGHFNVDSIGTDGTMRAGCHTLAFSEMLRLAIKESPRLVTAKYPVPAII